MRVGGHCGLRSLTPVWSVRSTFNWTVPFLSLLACLVLAAAAATLYLVPLRCIVLVWGKSRSAVWLAVRLR